MRTASVRRTVAAALVAGALGTTAGAAQAAPQQDDLTKGETQVGKTALVDRNGALGVEMATFAHDFAGTALPSGWPSSPGATVANGSMTVDGALVNHSATGGPARTLEFTATFGDEKFQHVGFGTTSTPDPVGDLQHRAVTSTTHWCVRPHSHRTPVSKRTCSFVRLLRGRRLPDRMVGDERPVLRQRRRSARSTTPRIGGNMHRQSVTSRQVPRSARDRLDDPPRGDCRHVHLRQVRRGRLARVGNRVHARGRPPTERRSPTRRRPAPTATRGPLGARRAPPCRLASSGTGPT